MLMQMKRKIFAVCCPENLISIMRETAENMCGIRDAEWSVSDMLTEEMRGCCIILFGSAYRAAVFQWTSDTDVIWITEQLDMAVLREGFVDALGLPLDRDRFAASFTNMVCRNDRKRRLDIRENELKTFFEISDDMLWTKDTGDLHMDVNHVLINLLGKTREQIEGKHENEIYNLSPGVTGCSQSDVFVRTTGKTSIFEESMPGADGQPHHLRVTKAPWLDGQEHLIGTVGLAKDVTELMNQRAKFERFLDDLNLGVIIADHDGMVLQTNKTYLDISGQSESETVGHKIKKLKFEKTREFGAEDYIIPGQDGREAIWTCNRYDLKNYWGEQYGNTYVFRNVTRERRQERKIMGLAVKDQLTGLPNRVGMYEYFDTMDKRGKASFLFIDIDNFKLVNDEYGHIVGDRLLKDVAGLFRNVLADSFTARLGGDEFISIVSGDIKRPELGKRAKALLRGIKRFPDYPEEVLKKISLSIGILYQYPIRDSFNNILRKSDQSMYQAKRMGKNRYCFYNPAEFSEMQRERGS